VDVTVLIHKQTLAMELVLAPLAFVLSAIYEDHPSFTVSLSIRELPTILITRSELENSSAIRLSVAKISFIIVPALVL
jgi:hypothetical protein